MQQTIEALKLIAEESSRNKKEDLLRAYDTQKLRFLLDLAYNPYKLFGVKKIVKGDARVFVPDIEELQELAGALIKREVTGNAARKLLSDTLTCSDSTATKYLFDIFTKDLSIGATVKTLNKVFPNLIPTFDIALCKVFEDTDTLPKGDWIIEPKYDGLRCVCFIDADGNVDFLSRNGKKLYNLEHIESAVKELGLKSVVFDGEAKGKEWNDSQSTLRSSRTKVDNKSLEYHIFDMIDLEQWKLRDTISLQNRKANLLKLKLESPLKCTPFAALSSTEKGKEIFKNLLSKGFEGAVIKDLNAKYSFKKGKDWLKWKETITEDLEITGYEEGEGKCKGKLGAFLCDLKGVEVRVGGGFTDKDRETFWANKEEMIGRVIEVMAQEVTKDGSLRFPRYVRTREDKD